jgi:A/G-specific adenine glycosylase
MQTTETQASFAHRVVAWQRIHGRNHLPWIAKSAYHVWLSEVMLQQTQVATVLPYYATFIHHYPTVVALAAAPIDDVLAKLAGLGYYSRARNLHRCAQMVVNQYHGQFPRSLVDLEALPGIGPSTAAAIASLAHQQRAAILDGNVKRVLARHGAVQGWPGTPSVAKQLWQLANERLISQDVKVVSAHHRRYTQGLMDLGATVCTAKQPNCHVCPIASDCQALHAEQIASIPASRPKKIIPNQARCALILHTRAGLWLERRPVNGLWGGLLSLPESNNEASLAELATKLGARSPLLPWHIHQLKHTFTHYHLLWQMWGVQVDEQFKLPQPWVFASWDKVQAAGVPKAVLKVLGR